MTTIGSTNGTPKVQFVQRTAKDNHIPLFPSSSSSNDPVPVTVNPFPASLKDYINFDVNKCTFVTISDGGLMNSISRFVGANGNRSFVIHKKNQSAIETQKFLAYDSDDEEESVIRKDKKVGNTSLSIGLGIHKFNYDGTDIYILFHHIGAPVGTSNFVQSYEAFLLFSEGVEKHEAIQKFVEHVVEWDEKTHENTFNIYKFHAQRAYWNKLGVKIARPLDSVILPPEVKSDFLRDLDDFLSPETFKWYKDHGIPYKRSYLLYGPPGSGKSSIIQAIAGHYKLNLCNIQPIDPHFTDDSFTEAIQRAPKNALIVLEDIDTYFGKDREALHSKCPLTFSGLLNGLDGVAAADGQVFILTTNYIDKLDSALIRTGRVDVKYPFPKVSADMARRMFLQFYPQQDKHAETFKDTISQILVEKDLCMADLQQHFISHRKNNAEIAAQPNSIKQEVTGQELEKLTAQLTAKSSDKKNDKNGNSSKSNDSEGGNVPALAKNDGKSKSDSVPSSKGSDSSATASFGNYVATFFFGVSLALAASLIAKRS